ncbi:MAG: hypothetical protein ACLGIE_06100 [Alphaproteobacteria bacterium]
MSDQDDTQESSSWLKAELGAIQPAPVKREPSKLRANVDTVLADMASRDVARREHDREVSEAGAANIAFTKYGAKFGWSEAQFVEYWSWRNNPLRKKEWTDLLDRERKRVQTAGKPRKNADVKGMTPEDAKAHRQKQVRKAVTLYRSKKAAEADAQAAATGKRALTDGELAVIEAAAAEVAEAPAKAKDQALADMLASLRAAEAAEGR